MTRLFIAVFPDDATRAALRALHLAPDPGARLVAEPNWHVTLRFLGEVDEADATEVARRLRDAELPACDAHLGPTTARLGARQIVVPVRGVEPLAAVVRDVTGDVGNRDDRPFFGHLTLARTRPGAGDELVNIPVSGAFEVEEIALVASDLRPDGAVYRVVERFAC